MRILTIDGINGQTALVLESGKTNVTIYKDSIENNQKYLNSGFKINEHKEVI